jgi:hypothetical protein
VLKQAHLVLAMHLRGDAFTDGQKARNFAYYERLTVRDSSLSACTQAAMAAEVGYLDLAYDYLAEAAMMDIRNLEHNTRDGLHVASLAGTWLALVAGLAGMREQKRHPELQAATPRRDQPTRHRHHRPATRTANRDHHHHDLPSPRRPTAPNPPQRRTRHRVHRHPTRPPDPPAPAAPHLRLSHAAIRPRTATTRVSHGDRELR